MITESYQGPHIFDCPHKNPVVWIAGVEFRIACLYKIAVDLIDTTFSINVSCFPQSIIVCDIAFAQ